MPLSNTRRGTDGPIGKVCPYHLAGAGTDNMQALILRTYIDIALKQCGTRNNAAIGWIFPLEFPLSRVQRIKIIIIRTDIKSTLRERGRTTDLIFALE